MNSHSTLEEARAGAKALSRHERVGRVVIASDERGPWQVRRVGRLSAGLHLFADAAEQRAARL
jgi:hypothetical protein